MMTMFSSEIRLGQAASHSPCRVQLPKNSSIRSTMCSVRASRSDWPWGRRLRWATLAAVKSWAAPLGQAATQAPQPVQAAGREGAAAPRGGDGVDVGLGGGAGRDRDVATALDDPVEGAAVDDEVAPPREGRRPPGFD